MFDRPPARVCEFIAASPRGRRCWPGRWSVSANVALRLDLRGRNNAACIAHFSWPGFSSSRFNRSFLIPRRAVGARSLPFNPEERIAIDANAISDEATPYRYRENIFSARRAFFEVKYAQH